MIITSHGKKDPLFKGASKHLSREGRGLVFFGWNAKQVQNKEREWLLANQPVSPQVRETKRPELRVINGGKVSAA